MLGRAHTTNIFIYFLCVCVLVMEMKLSMRSFSLYLVARVVSNKFQIDEPHIDRFVGIWSSHSSSTWRDEASLRLIAPGNSQKEWNVLSLRCIGTVQVFIIPANDSEWIWVLFGCQRSGRAYWARPTSTCANSKPVRPWALARLFAVILSVRS